MDAIVWIYKQWLKFQKWRNTYSSVQYFMITTHGDQIPIYTPTKSYISMDGFLAVHTCNGSIQYQFTQNYTVAKPVESSVEWIGMQVCIHGKMYELNANEYLVASNHLFTDTFNYWLCKKLRVEPTKDVEVNVIDMDINVKSLTSSVVI
jgi:hypothetical protein